MPDRDKRIGRVVWRLAGTLSDAVGGLRAWQAGVQERLGVEDLEDLEIALVGLEAALLTAELASDACGAGGEQ